MRAAPKSITIHTQAHAQDALQAAQTLGVPVILQSAPDALFYAGGAYLLAMFRQAKAQFPKVDATFILNCADAGAETIEALRIGHTHICSSAPEDIRKKLEYIAAANGACLVENSNESLDLHTVRDTKEACLKWLKGEPCQ